VSQMTSIPLLPQTTDQIIEGNPNFSRWVSLDFLIDLDEMRAFLKELEPFHLLSSTPIQSEDPFYLSQQDFLNAYSYYISELKEGRVPDPKRYKPYFHLFLTTLLDGVLRREVGSGKEILKISIPTLLVRPICLNLSKVDQSIRVGPLNPEGILWGLQISFPQLMQKAGAADIEPIKPQADPNAMLFKKVRGWIRSHTKPTLFKVNEKEVSVPIRLGKKCLSWINSHPQFKEQLSIST